MADINARGLFISSPLIGNGRLGWWPTVCKCMQMRGFFQSFFFAVAYYSKPRKWRRNVEGGWWSEENEHDGNCFCLFFFCKKKLFFSSSSSSFLLFVQFDLGLLLLLLLFSFFFFRSFFSFFFCLVPPFKSNPSNDWSNPTQWSPNRFGLSTKDLSIRSKKVVKSHWTYWNKLIKLGQSQKNLAKLSKTRWN